MNFSRIVLLATLSATPLLAQRGGRGNPPVRDTTAARRTPDGAVLDFKDQDIQIVLQAIAEAGNLQVAIQRPPSARVTLRVSQQMTREAAIQMLKQVAEANEFTVTETPALIMLVGPVPAPRTPPGPNLTPQQQQQQAQINRLRQIYTVRLKHATASTVAPMLMSLLRGTGNFATGANGRGITTPNVNGAAGGGRGGAAGAGGAGGGRGAGGRGAAQGVTIPQVIGAPAGIQQLANLFGGGGGGGGGVATTNLAFSDIVIQGDDGTNSLLIFATPDDFQQIQPLIQSVDLRPLQALIEVTIAQVERSNDLNVGVSAVTSKNGRKTTTTGTTTTNASGVTTGTSTSTTTGKVDTTGLLPSAASARDFIMQLVGGKGAVNYAVAMNALHSIGDVRVLSLPLIIAQNNKQAILNVGSRVPFVSVTQTVPNDPTGRVNTVQYQDVGTTLTLTPTINTDGYVNLAVTQTSDNLSNNVQFDAQIINQRQAQTTVFVRDGQTTVIGGLTDNTQSNSRSGIPILSRIPLIGWLFGNTQKNKTTTELYVFLTPHIVSTDEDMDHLRDAVRGGSDLLKDVDLQRIKAAGDTIKIGIPRDSAKKLPPPARRDTMPTPAR